MNFHFGEVMKSWGIIKVRSSKCEVSVTLKKRVYFA